MVSSRGQKKLGPCPDRSPLGVYFKISDEHPHPFHMQSPPPPPSGPWGSLHSGYSFTNKIHSYLSILNDKSKLSISNKFERYN